MSFTGFALVEILMDGKWHLASDKENNEVFFEKYGRLLGEPYTLLLEELDNVLFYTVDRPGPNGEVELIPSDIVLKELQTNEQEFIETGGKSLRKEYSLVMYKFSSFLNWLNRYMDAETLNEIKNENSLQCHHLTIVRIIRIISEIVKQVDDFRKKHRRRFDYERDVRILLLSGF